MTFTQEEVRFLLEPRRIEYANKMVYELRQAVDTRDLGCPEHIFFRVLEDRAKRMGTKFWEFRKAHQPQETRSFSAVEHSKENLLLHVESSKIF